MMTQLASGGMPGGMPAGMPGGGSGGMPGMAALPGAPGKRAKGRQPAKKGRTKRGSGNPAKRAQELRDR